MWTWGLNTSGQLGNGTTTRSLQPIIVSIGWTATAIAAGHFHTLAVRSDGSLWGWGWNNAGQLGAASPTQWLFPVLSRVSPARFPSQPDIVTPPSSGVTVACCLSGCNSWGQLGNNTTTNRPTMDLVFSLQNVAAIRSGFYFTSALTMAGEVWSWGDRTPRTDGQWAHDHPEGSGADADGWRCRAPGRRPYTWGCRDHDRCRAGVGGENYGQIGDGTTLGRLTPVAISDVNYAWKVATPTVSLATGTYATDQTVVIANSTAGAEIHYSTNGVDPTVADPVIASSASLAVDRTMTLKVRAWKSDMPPSDIVAATYTMAVALPSVSPNGATFTTPQTVVATTTTPGVTLRYTTDTTNPTESSAIYSAPLQISTTTTLKVTGFRLAGPRVEFEQPRT